MFGVVVGILIIFGIVWAVTRPSRKIHQVRREQSNAGPSLSFDLDNDDKRSRAVKIDQLEGSQWHGAAAMKNEEFNYSDEGTPSPSDVITLYNKETYSPPNPSKRRESILYYTPAQSAREYANI